MSVCFTQGARFALRLLAIFAAVLSLNHAQAASLYWDTNGSVVYSGNAGGIWGTDAFWSSDVHGLTATGAYSAGNDVVFAAGTDGTGTYTVTLSSNQSAAGLNFMAGHVTIASATTTDFDSLQVLTLAVPGGGVPVVNVQNMDSIITSRMRSAGLTKTGVGKLTLNYGAFGNGSYFDFSAGVITVNGGTLELAGTGGSANQLNAAAGIVINSGGTFLWGSGVNNISDGARITVNTGGTLVTRVNDQIGTLAGSGLISIQGGAVNMQIGGNATVFSGIIAGGGTLQFNNGTGSLTLTNANTFSGTINVQTTNTSAGSIRLGHNRAAQNATLKLPTYSTATSNFSFASGIGTFVVGALGGSLTEGIADLVLQDTAGAAITLQVGNNDTSTIYRGTLKGSGGLTKIGAGTLTLTGETIVVTSTPSGGSTTVLNSTDLTSTHTYTGDTTILGGTHSNSGINSTTASTLKLDFNAQAQNTVTSGGITFVTTGTAATTNIINSASRLVLGGGRLQVIGNNGGGTVSQTFNNTLLTPSRSYVTVTLGTTTGDTLVNLGNITREAAGAVLEFTLPTTASSATNGITTTTANDASGILGGWALVGTDWAIKSTAGTAIGNVVAAGAGVYTAFAGGEGGNVAGSGITNLLVNDATVIFATPGGITDLNTLMVRNNGASTVNRTLDIAAGETLRLGVTGSIWNQGTGTLAVGASANTGTLTAGGAANTAGEIILNNHAGAGEMVINSRITDNGSGAVTLVRTGSGGQVVLAASNTHTGGSVFTQGRTVMSNAGALGTGAVTVTPGGQLWINVSGTYANNFFIAGTGHGEGGVPGAIRVGGTSVFNGTFTLTGDARLGGVNGGNITLTGKVTGDYALDLSGYQGSLNVITLSNTSNDFTGNLSINTNLNTTTVFNASSVITVRLGASEVIPNGLGKGNVVMNGGSGTVTLDLNGFNETINSLISYTHTNLFITNAKLGTTSTLTIGDNNTSTLVASNANHSTFFGGVIRDTTGAGTGIMALTKIGEGTQTLTGANTYSGTTTINKGILMAGAVNTLSANSAVVIANDATAMLALTNGIADFSQTIKSLAGGGTVNLGTIAAADTVAAPVTRLTTGDSTDTTYSGVIVGGGGLVKQGAGRFTLTGANTYVGTTQVTVGNLQVGQSGSGQSGTGAVSVSSGATLSGSGFVQGATTINGLVSAGDNGGTSIGRLVFTDVSADSLSLAGGGSAAAPRALFTLAGATGNEASPMDGIQTASLLNGTFGNHDALVVQGTLTLAAGSTIKVELGSGYTPGWGDVFNLIDWGTVNGGSGAIVAGGFNEATDLDLEVSSVMLANGWFWETNQFLTDGIIYVVPEPGRAMLAMIGLALIMGRRRRWAVAGS